MIQNSLMKNCFLEMDDPNKLEILDRVGLRISAGFNKGTIGQGRWKLNSRYLIGDSEKYTLSGVTFRTMLYLGL